MDQDHSVPRKGGFHPSPPGTWFHLLPCGCHRPCLLFYSRGPLPFPGLSVVGPSLHLKVFSYGLFMSKLRACLSSCGLSGKDFGSHSFRRGGASFAFSIGVPVELIKVLSDWKSNAVLLYLTLPLNIRFHTSTLISQHIPLH